MSKPNSNNPGSGVSISIAGGVTEFYDNGTAKICNGSVMIYEAGQASFANGAIDLGTDTAGQVSVFTGYAVNTVKVVGEQQPAIPDGGDSTTLAILAALRAHGLIAS